MRTNNSSTSACWALRIFHVKTCLHSTNFTSFAQVAVDSWKVCSGKFCTHSNLREDLSRRHKMDGKLPSFPFPPHPVFGETFIPQIALAIGVLTSSIGVRVRRICGFVFPTSSAIDQTRRPCTRSVMER